MRKLTFLLTFVLISNGAHALDAPAWPDGPIATLPKGEYILSGNTTLSYDKLEISDDTIITTSRYDLEIHIRQELILEGNAVIRSFDQTNSSQMPPTPGQPTKASDGDSYDRGPRTEGSSVASKGTDGGQGKLGAPGATGAVGYDAGLITIRLDPGAKASGTLVIRNNGGTGGAGGQGGQGGNGGDGQQGGRGQPAPIGCAKGPGEGGRAGDGGPGGAGGRGGDGGRGGTIVLQATSASVSKWFDSAVLTVDGGDPGKSGEGGQGGQSGQPGYGGRGSSGCQGKEADRMGQPGSPGKPGGESPTKPSPGSRGRVKIL